MHRSRAACAYIYIYMLPSNALECYSSNNFRKDFPSCAYRCTVRRSPLHVKSVHTEDTRPAYYSANDTSLPRTTLVKRTAVADSTGLEMVTKPRYC